MQDYTPYLSAKLPDLAAIEQLVAGERPGFAVDGKIRLKNRDLTDFHLADPPNPDDPSDCSSFIVTPPVVDINTSRDVMGQVDVEMDLALGWLINTLDILMEFRVVYYDMTDLTSGEPAVLMDVPVLIAGFQIPDRILQDGPDTLKVTGYDLTWKLRNLYFQNPFALPAGMKVTDVIGAMLRMDNNPCSEGGRCPTGVTTTGPQGSIPTGAPAYCSIGTPATTICTTVNADGSLEDPYGMLRVNPFGGILMDPATHFPIDPFTCHPMTWPIINGTPIQFWADTFQASNGLWFNTWTGAFYQANYPHGYATYPIDPFTMQPLPAGRIYYHPDLLELLPKAGNTPCPLATWPYDYTGAGPFYQTGGAAQSSSGGGSSPSSGPGPSSLPIGSPATIAVRSGTSTTTLVSAGTYTIQPALCSNDPMLPGHQWCQPRGGVLNSDTAAVTGYDWPAGTWTISLLLSGGPLPAGQAAISADLYAQDADGSLTLLAHFSAGATETLDGTSGVSSVTLSCSGAVAAYTAAAGARIMAHISLEAITPLTCTMGTAVTGGSFSVSAVTVAFPVPTVTTTTVTPPTITGGNGSTTPSQTGTWVPWPDSNNPGMCPNGCETPGPNIPNSRISITTSTLPLASTISWDRKINFMAAIKQLTDSIVYEPIWAPLGTFEVHPQPLFSESVPAAVWSFTTEANQVIKPPFTQRINDQAGLFYNRLILMSQPNNGTPITLLGKNESLGSAISYPNLGEWVMGPPIQDDTIPDLTTAERRLEAELQRSASAMEGIEFTVACVPFLQPFDPLSVTITALDGETLVDAGAFPYFVSQLTFDFGDLTNCKLVASRSVAV